MAKKFFTSIWFIWFASYILLVIAVGIYTNNGALRGRCTRLPIERSSHGITNEISRRKIN